MVPIKIKMLAAGEEKDYVKIEALITHDMKQNYKSYVIKPKPIQVNIMR